MFKFEVVYESYPIIKKENMLLFSSEGRALCRKVIDVECLDNYHYELIKGLEEEGFSNHMMHFRKLNEDGSTDKEFEEMRFNEFYNKFPKFREVFSEVNKLGEDK